MHKGLSQCSNFIKENNITEHIRADTAGSAEMISKTKDKKKAAIASSLSAEIYNLRNVIKKNIRKREWKFNKVSSYGKKYIST